MVTPSRLKTEVNETNMATTTTLILRVGALIDGTGRDVARDVAIKISDGRIAAVGRDADFGTDLGSEYVSILDARDKWALPGLINMHEHLMMREVHGFPWDVTEKSLTELTVIAAKNAVGALRRGWTTVRDMGARQRIALELRDLVARGDMPGPRMIVCGSPIAVTGGHGFQISVEADGPEACRRAAREQLKAGADFLKVMASHDPYPMPGDQQTRPEMALEECKAVFDEARRWGKKTACHVMGGVAIENVLDAGVDIIDHGIYLDEGQAERMAATGVVFCPTLSAYGRQSMNPIYERGEAWVKAHEVLVAPLLASFEWAVKAGVTIVNGTDTTGWYAEEVDMMRAAGVSPMDSLLACTRNAAGALGLEAEVGTVEPGKAADLVLLDHDPLNDPYALDTVYRVVKDGAVIDPDRITL